MICGKCNKEIGNASECPYCGAIALKAPLPHHLPVGTLIGGKFRVEGVLGEGGFGITYLTKNEKLGSQFAIKEYYPRGISFRDNTGSNEVYASSEDDTEFFIHGKERFLSEARTLARFSDEPGVVSVTDYIEENGTVYLVMEYLKGETLQQYLKHSGNLSADKAFSMLEPVIRTLEKIHDAGVIHRDISPDNIMVLKNGQLKLMDFGASKEFIDDNRSMSVMLKKGYAPMEQYRRNGKQGPWTDVYAMCATIYRCITGKTPEDALDRVMEDTLQKPSALGAAITPEQEQVLLRGLAVNQRDRCQNMTELLSLWKRAGQFAATVNSAEKETKEKPIAPQAESVSNTNTNVSIYHKYPDPNATEYADAYKNNTDTTDYANEYRNSPNATVLANESMTAHPPTWNQPNPVPHDPKKKSKKGILIGAIATALVLVIVAGIVLISSWNNNHHETNTNNNNSGNNNHSETNTNNNNSGNNNHSETNTNNIKSGNNNHSDTNNSETNTNSINSGNNNYSETITNNNNLGDNNRSETITNNNMTSTSEVSSSSSHGSNDTLHYKATGQTSYGYDWSCSGGEGVVSVNCIYDFSSHEYDFSISGVSPGTTSLTLYYNTDDSTQVPVAMTVRVDSNLNVSQIE